MRTGTHGSCTHARVAETACERGCAQEPGMCVYHSRKSALRTPPKSTRQHSTVQIKTWKGRVRGMLGNQFRARSNALAATKASISANQPILPQALRDCLSTRPPPPPQNPLLMPCESKLTRCDGCCHVAGGERFTVILSRMLATARSSSTRPAIHVTILACACACAHA